MPPLPDVQCWIKVIDGVTGRAVANGKDLGVPGTAIVRFVVANDGDRPAGPMWIVGALYRDGVRLRLTGREHVVPAQQVELQAREVWKHEHAVSEGRDAKGLVSYSARILVDAGAVLNEDDATNHRAQHAFGFLNIT
jgi:hypothetical protein